MKANFLQLSTLIVLTLLVTLATPAASYAQDKKSGDDIKALINRIDALEKKVKEQDTKIAELNNEISRLQNPMLAIPHIPNMRELPKGSKPFNFNGQTYYMVPIKNEVEVK